MAAEQLSTSSVSSDVAVRDPLPSMMSVLPSAEKTAGLPFTTFVPSRRRVTLPLQQRAPCVKGEHLHRHLVVFAIVERYACLPVSVGIAGGFGCDGDVDTARNHQGCVYHIRRSRQCEGQRPFVIIGIVDPVIFLTQYATVEICAHSIDGEAFRIDSVA